MAAVSGTAANVPMAEAEEADDADDDADTDGEHDDEDNDESDGNGGFSSPEVGLIRDASADNETGSSANSNP